MVKKTFLFPLHPKVSNIILRNHEYFFIVIFCICFFFISLCTPWLLHGQNVSAFRLKENDVASPAVASVVMRVMHPPPHPSALLETFYISNIILNKLIIESQYLTILWRWSLLKGQCQERKMQLLSNSMWVVALGYGLKDVASSTMSFWSHWA